MREGDCKLKGLDREVFIQGKGESRYIGRLVKVDREFVCLEGVKLVTDKGSEKELPGPFCLRRSEIRHMHPVEG